MSSLNINAVEWIKGNTVTLNPLCPHLPLQEFPFHEVPINMYFQIYAETIEEMQSLFCVTLSSPHSGQSKSCLTNDHRLTSSFYDSDCLLMNNNHDTVK